MNSQEEKCEHKKFQKEKIKTLNKFFMKNVVLGLAFVLLTFVLSTVMLILSLFLTDMDAALKISIISMIVTFVITTSKSLIDKMISVVSFIVKLLGEEQRGLNKNIGIEIEEVDLDFEDNNEKNNDD